MLKIIYIRNKKVEQSITYINIYKHMNTYSTVFNNYRIAKPHNVKKTYYNYNNHVFIKKHNTINTNGTYTLTNTNSVYIVTGNNYYAKT